MPIDRPLPPTSATQAFRAGLAAFVSGPGSGGPAIITRQNHIGGIPILPSETDFGGPGPWDHDPQEVFTLGLADLLSGPRTNAAKSAGWRFFAGNAAGKTALGHCSTQAATGIWDLTGMSYGDRAYQLLQASNGLDHHGGIPPRDNYTLRVLTIPGLLLEAFWLVSAAGGTDLAVVFPPPPHQLHRQLNSQAVYHMPAFLTIAADLAIYRSRFAGEHGS